MSEAYIGEIRMFGFNFVPRGWMRCEGQTMPISSNQALFSLLGTTYGGDGIQTFALPDLRGRAPVHFDSSGNSFHLGERAGEETHVLTQAEIPAHTHVVSARATATTAAPDGALWAESLQTAFGTGSNTTMSPGALGAAGQGQAHDNMPPYLAITSGICVVGIFPSRN
ncbi:MAG: phage tail protein [Nocardioides sp.]|nr:phage tail protein [Nocardioides sp.]